MSCTCFEPEGLYSGRRLYIQLWYGTFYMHQYWQSVDRRVYSIAVSILVSNVSSLVGRRVFSI